MAFEVIPRSAAEALVATGQFEWTDGKTRIRYRGGSGAKAWNELGAWCDDPKDENATVKNSRPVEPASQPEPEPEPDPEQ